MRKTIKRLTSIMLAASMMLSMAGCGKKTKNVESANYGKGDLISSVEVDPADPVQLDDKFLSSNYEFAMNIFKACAADDIKNGKNIMISPVSIQTALGMTANGANGSTLTCMEDVICPGLDINSLNCYLNTFNNKLTTSNGDDIKFSVANSIWIRDEDERISVNDEFLKQDKKYYNASAFLENFDDATKDKINGWVNENTNGMIKDVISDIPDAVVMYLINTIAFEADWDENYEESQVHENQIFTNAFGLEENATMLYSLEHFYCETENAKAVVKNYKGGQYSFVGILPNEDISLEDYVASLSGDEYRKLMESRTSQYDVITRIPEFSYDWDADIAEVLESLGMRDALHEDADFHNMATTESGYLYIQNVIHKTHIEVDRDGTKASAATVVVMTDCETCEPVEVEMKEVILDRPFVYAIIDNETNIPIFVGVVNTMN